jgi:hypothetical protein
MAQCTPVPIRISIGSFDKHGAKEISRQILPLPKRQRGQMGLD